MEAAAAPPHLMECPQHNQTLGRYGTLRVNAGVPHGDFLLFMQSHPASSKLMQQWMYKDLRQRSRQAPEEAILVQLIYSRVLSAVVTGSDLFDMARYVVVDGPSSPDRCLEEIVSLMRVRGWRTADDVIRAIGVEEDKLPVVPPAPHLVETVRKASAILSESK